MKTVILIDTSIQGAALGVADLETGRLMAWVYHDTNMGAAQRLPELLHQVLQKAQLPLSAIDAVAVSHGPGSFTGIKVGLAFAQGLVAGMQTQPRIWSCSGLGAGAVYIARQMSQEVAIFLPQTKTKGCVVKATADDHDIEVADLDDGASDRLILLGESSFAATPWPALEAKFEAKGRKLVGISLLPEPLLYGMAEQARQAWPDQFKMTMPQALYLRPSTVEEKLS